MDNKKKQFSAETSALFCKQMAMFLNSGIPLYDAFSILCENAASPAERHIFHNLASEVEVGSSLFEAMNAQECFPQYMIRMIAIGETSGKLEEVFNALATYYERADNIRESVKNAIIYPVIMVIGMLLIMAVLLINILPVFSQVFDQVGAQMPAFLQLLVDARTTVTIVTIVFFSIIVIMAVLYFIARKRSAGHAKLLHIYENFPFVRKISEKSESSKFTFALSLLLSSGIDMDQSIEMIDELTESEKTKKLILNFRNQLDDNIPLPAALRSSGLLPSKYCAMIAVGVKSGNADEMMNIIADKSAEDTDQWIGNVISCIEPTLVILMSLIIGAFLVAVMLPLINIMTAI